MINLGLSRTQRLLNHIAREILNQSKFDPPWKAVHIAGTNGKGSVAAYLAAYLHLALRKNGQGKQRIGRFTSPHFIDRWDCIQINNEPVSQRLFEDTETQVRGLALRVAQELENESTKSAKQLNVETTEQIKKDSRPTEFEILTATAFALFSAKQNAVEFAIIECGLGGRLDATNALPDSAIAASTITRIGLDHVDMLGGSLESIVREKCGIFRENIPIVFDGLNEQKVIAMITNEIRAKYRSTRESELVGIENMAPGNVYSIETFDIQKNVIVSSDSKTESQRSKSPALDAKAQQSEIHLTEQGSEAFQLMPHQLTNLGVAFKAAEIAVSTRSQEGYVLTTRTPDILDTIISDANRSYPARLQLMKPGWLESCPSHRLTKLNTCHVLLDGAHNAQSADVLKRFVLEYTAMTPCSVVFVMGLSRSGDRNKVFETIFNSDSKLEESVSYQNLGESKQTYNQSQNSILQESKIYGTGFGPVQGMPWIKPRGRNEIENIFHNLELGDRATYLSDNIVETLEEVENHISGSYNENGTKRPLVVVAGSLYLASDFLRFLRDGRRKYLEWFEQR